MSLIQQVLSKNIAQLKKFRFIIVQHLMSDTYNFLLELINAGIEISYLFVKEYSYDDGYLNKLQGMIPIKVITGEMTPCYKNILEDAIEKSKSDSKKIAILDLGGEFSSLLSNIKTEKTQIVVVEDTAFGHRKYERLIIKNRCISLFSVAKSKFKEIEAKFVGESIVNSAEQVFRSFGQTIVGRKVLVIGYGMIGKNVAKVLKETCCIVSVYDNDDIKMCSAYFEGYNVGKLHNLLKENTIVFGVTGDTSICHTQIRNLLNQTILISGSSKQIEFAKQLIDNANPFSEHVDKCNIEGKEIYLFNKGYPINFISKSVPDCIIEFLFAEMLMCLVESSDNKNTSKQSIRELSLDGMNIISQQFLISQGKRM